MSKNDGGPAFPCVNIVDGEENWSGGMSLRDYFAASVISARFTFSNAPQNIKDRDIIPEVVSFAYAVADAMIAERAK